MPLSRIKKYIKAQKCKTINGCGPWWFPNFLRNQTFGSACEFHDHKYSIGGSETDRQNADKLFYQRMLEACNKLNGMTKDFYQLQAKIYYFLVKNLGKYRVFGRFNYHDKTENKELIVKDE